MDEIISPELVQKLSYQGLMDYIYNKLQQLPEYVHHVEIQYSVKDGQSCKWGLEILEEQDIADACIFVKGLASVNEDNVQLESMKLVSMWPATSGNWGGNNWREREGSPATPEGS